MTQKLKICMIGATAVGKTSLVGEYVSSIFSETYRTTIGVKIETRVVQRGDEQVELVLWDLSGEDEFQSVQPAYLRGASGYLLVIDGTRADTIGTAVRLSARVQSTISLLPFVVVLNKADDVASWAIGPAEIERMKQRGWIVVRTSAKTGAGVDEAFSILVDEILRARSWS